MAAQQKPVTFAAKAKKIMLKYNIEFSDMCRILGQAIKNVKEEISHIEHVRAFSNSEVYSIAELDEQRQLYYRLVKQYKNEKWLCIRILIFIDENKRRFTSFETFSSFILNSKFGKLRYYWTNKILEKFRIEMMDRLNQAKRQRLILLDRLRFIKENRYNYNLLEIEDMLLDEVNYNDIEYDVGIEALNLETKYNDFWHEKVDYFKSKWEHEPVYVDPEPIYRNSFLLYKLRSILESFRRLRMPSLGIPRDLFIFSNSPAAVREEWSAIYRPTTRVLEGNSDIPLNDLSEIEFVREAIDYESMIEDPKEKVFPQDHIVCCKSKVEIIVRPECQMMDEAHGDCDNLQKEQEGNVILTTHVEEPSTTQPITIDAGIWEQMCSPQKITEYSQLMSRWQQITTVKWSNGDAVGTELSNKGQGMILPKFFITKFQESPSCILFKTYAFFRSDLEIRIVVNSNKFHCGQLQASFYYGASLDAHYKDRQNVFSASQLPHAIIDAASASDAILKIPYRHYKPMMATASRSDDNVILDLGLLRLLVLNKLQQPVSDTSKIDVSIFMRFVNPSFHGMKPRDIGVINEMMGMASLVKETANLVNQIYPDQQRDNPSDVIPPKPMVPWSAHSWCVGDVNPEPINPLRLQATGNTPHLPGTIPKEPEMTIKYIQEIFGLIKQVNWSTSDAHGTILVKMPFSPDLDDYPQVTLSNPTARVCNIMPPVSVMSRLFAYWRGSLEYKIDFISTQFHTGRLIIAYVPRVVMTSQPTIEQLTFCDHVIVDLRDGKEISYVNSFLADKPWYPRRSSSNYSTENYPPGYIYIGVMTQLTATTSVSPSIDFNIYLRAGKDFELHIPVCPSIGLSFNTQVYDSKVATISYLPSYGPPNTSMYTGRWHTTGEGLILRYGPASDHVTQFDISQIGNVYKLVDETQKIINPKVSGNLVYLVVFTIAGTYAYGAVFGDQASASAFLKLLDNGKMTDAALAKMTMSDTDGDYLDQSRQFLWKKILTSEFGFEFIEAQAGDQRKDECGMNVQVQNQLRSTASGLFTFGEQITNIKQLCRRYMPYGQYTIMRKKNSDPSIADIAIPLLPQGLDVLPSISGVEFRYGNQIRDGPIPLLASGYRFFRGSMRLRIIIAGRQDGVVWVQHRPEYNLQSLSIFEPDKNYSSAIYQPGYASLIQLTSMNNVIELEIPFYLPGQFGMLQRPSLGTVEDAVHFSLGVLYLGFDVMKDRSVDIPYNVTILYSMGDDMTFSVFQGFPPMIDLTEFNKPKIEAQGLGDSIRAKMSGYFKEELRSGMIDVLQQAAQEQEPSISEPIEGEPVVTSEEQSPDISALIAKIFPDMTQEKKLVLVNIFGNLIHCAINPNISTIAWSIANMFVTAGCMCISLLEKLSNTLKRLISSLCNCAKKSEQAANVVIQNGPSPVDERARDEAAFVSTCVAGILALAGAVNKPLPTKIPDFAKYLYDGMPKFSLTANGIFIFLTNNINMFKKIWFWLVSKWDSNYILYTEMAGAPEELVTFIKQVQFCLDARNSLKVRKDPFCTIRVYELANKAQAFLAKRAVCDMNKPMPLLEMYCKNVIKLRDTLTSEMLSPAIRFEPFVISFNGPSNVGKSHLAQSIAEQMMTAIDYRTYNEIVYTRTPGNQYWNGLSNQPVCLFDDFLNITDSQHSLTQLGELYCLKSKAVFNPPMAAIEEKRIRYNPLLVLLCNNKAFPKIEGLAMEEAWMRRRDLLIEVRKLPEYANVHPRQLPDRIKKNYGHLRFCFYKNPAGMTSAERELEKPESELKNWMTFEELNARIGSLFLEYFDEECKQYDSAVNRLKQFYPRDEESTEDYCKRVNREVEALNNSRVNDRELAEITKMLEDLHTDRHTADMTGYIKKKIIERKKRELEHQELTVAQVHTPLELPIEQLVVIEQQGLGDHHDSDIALNFFSKHECFPFLDKKSFKDHFDNSCVPIPEDPACYCSHIVPFVTGFSVNSVSRRLLFNCDLRPFCKRNCGVDTEVIFRVTICEGDCALVNSQIFEYLCSLQCSPQLSRIQSDYLPVAWRNIIEDARAQPDTMTYMTPQEVENKILAEALDKKWYQRLWEKVPGFGKIIRWILGLGALVASIGALVRVAGYFIASPTAAETKIVKAETEKKYWQNNLMFEAAVEASFSPKDMKDFAELTADKTEESVNYSVGTKASKPAPAVPIKAFANASEQQELVISERIKRNTFWLLAEFDDVNGRSTRPFRCLGLVERKFILLDHYIFFFKQCQNLKMHVVRQNMFQEIPVECVFNVKRMVNSTICIGTLTKQCSQFKNIINFFAPSSYTKNMSPSAILYEPCINVDKCEFVMKEHFFKRIGIRHRVDVKNDDGSTSIVSSVYSYDYSGRGVCGSVLVSNANTPAPILGLHIAGMTNGGEGYAEAIVYESLAPLLDRTNIVEAESTLVKVSIDKSPVLSLNGNIELIGTVDNQLACRPAKETRLIPTVCANKITEVTYAVPVLSPLDARIVDNPFSPLLEGCKYHASICKFMEKEYVETALEDVRNMILANLEPQRMNVGILSVEEAVCGILDNPLYEPMAMDTSEGFPWNKMRPPGATDKSWMFERELTNQGYKLLGMYEPLKQCLKERELLRRNGQYCQTIFVDTLKDAKLPKEKVLIPGKTRIFSVSPVDFTIVLRQYTTDFVTAYTAARIKTEHAIGIDITGLEANKLVEYMMEYGDNHICGDYSKFGDQLYAELVFGVYDIITSWYKKQGVNDIEFENVLKCFAEETANATHLMYDSVYKCLGGMPSGNPLTVIINSIVNSCYVRIVWQKIMFENKLLCYFGMDKFKEFARVVTFGDDLWISVKNEIKDVYNAVTMAEAFRAYNIKFTNATKGEEVIPYASIYSPDVTFLKRSFVKHPVRSNIWMSKIEKRIVEETCNWTWKTRRDIVPSSIEACIQMLELAYGQGPEYYMTLRQKVIDFWIQESVHVSIPTWSQIDLRIYDA